jgi:putative PIN family toxin of toxin-antitoxin system
MKVVLDTNVLASGLVGLPREKSTPGEILRRWHAGSFDLVTSEAILTETARTLTKYYFQKQLPPGKRLAAVETLRRRAFVVHIMESVEGVASHPEDDLVLATAVAGHAEYLVTGDNGLLAVESFQNDSIVSPQEFLALLDSGSMGQ